MSKSISNKNLFNSKNISNSNDLSDVNITNLICDNATITTITNNELQSATTALTGLTYATSGDLTTIDNNVSVTGSLTASAFYHTPRMVIYNFDKDQVTNNLWGGDNISDTVTHTLSHGDAFCSISSGIITISVSGFYRVKYQATVENDGQNDRMTVGVGMKKDSTSYWKQDNKSFFGAAYLRDDSFGDMASFQFEDYIDITASSTLRFLTKINLGSNSGFADTTDRTNLDWFGSVTIELIKLA